jgi:hypothetical protein
MRREMVAVRLHFHDGGETIKSGYEGEDREERRADLLNCL